MLCRSWLTCHKLHLCGCSLWFWHINASLQFWNLWCHWKIRHPSKAKCGLCPCTTQWLLHGILWCESTNDMQEYDDCCNHAFIMLTVIGGRLDACVIFLVGVSHYNTLDLFDTRSILHRSILDTTAVSYPCTQVLLSFWKSFKRALSVPSAGKPSSQEGLFG